MQEKGESPLTQACREISGEVHTHRAGTHVETNEAERKREEKIRQREDRREEKEERVREGERETERNVMGC